MHVRISISFTIAACLLTLLLSACSGNSNKYVIGVSQCSEDIWRDKLNSELKMGELLNDSLIVKIVSSNDDSKKQTEQVNQFIDEGVDLLIVAPNQLGILSTAIDRAYDAGIPVVLYDRKSDSEKYTAFMGCDNYLIGQSMGSFIAQRLQGNGRVVEIRGLEGSSPALERHRGFVDAIKNYPKVSLVTSEAGDWKEESGGRAMKRILQQTQDFDFVYCHNDRMAKGAYNIVQQMGITRPYRYTGVDGMATEGGGLEMVKEGILEASYLYPTKGDELIALVLKILSHQPFKRDNYLSTSIVTESNAELTLMEAKDTERQRNNLKLLHRQVDRYLSDYKTQKVLLSGLFAVIFILIVAAVLIFRGYVIKVRLNEQLAKKNEELEHLNNEVMELTHSRLVFFTNISHELRTPLTLIADPIEMLLEEGGIKGRSRELLKMVQRNAKALQQLVGSILDFRKIQNGKMELSLTRFDIVKALSVWTGDFQLTAERKHIQLQLDTSSYTSSPEIIADKEKVSRILFNLLSNAFKYTPVNGKIIVSLGNAQETDVIEGYATRHLLRISVKDTGKGIPSEERDKVFERFFQSKGASGGTGIGLALVKSFVELHHGTARVESEYGHGSNFIVILPCMQEGEIKDEAASTTEVDETVLQYIDDNSNQRGNMQQLVEEQGEKPTLLIIDDNNDIRQYERTLLQDRYIVLEAADGKEGIEIAMREVPDLVICDVMMPIMDGLEFTERLKTHVATSHIPVIMLTAKNLEEHRAEGYDHGADSYITKPFHAKVLLARIDNLLKQRCLLKNIFQKHSLPETEIEESSMDDRDKAFIKKLHEIIQSNLSNNDCSVEDIGRKVGLSRVQLYRKVKALTGTSVVDLLRKARLAKAHRLLESNGKNISEVAYEVGFTSPSYFTKCFKEEFGILPGEVDIR
ncbi:MAG: substrate-binding domain-containing protein [Prevotellaceae bacterium]|nr:substrate-binding domain-containing protein [Prevotellaceae bacterium]